MGRHAETALCDAMYSAGIPEPRITALLSSYRQELYTYAEADVDQLFQELVPDDAPVDYRLGWRHALYAWRQSLEPRW